MGAQTALSTAVGEYNRLKEHKRVLIQRHTELEQKIACKKILCRLGTNVKYIKEIAEFKRQQDVLSKGLVVVLKAIEQNESLRKAGRWNSTWKVPTDSSQNISVMPSRRWKKLLNADIDKQLNAE